MIMKRKLMTLSFLLGMLTMVSCSDDDDAQISNNQVPEKVQMEFNQRYPQAKDVKWEKVKEYHVARFNTPQTRGANHFYTLSAWFSEVGKFLQTDEDLDFNELPLAVQEGFTNYQKQFYPDWDFDDCELLNREEMGVIFVVEIEKGDLEREISLSEFGDILKDVLDDDDEDDILPIDIPQAVYDALENIFPQTHNTLSILELEIDDDEIEIDVLESNRHKEVKLDVNYQLVAIEYEVSLKEAQELMDEQVMQQLLDMAKKAGCDLFDEEVQKRIEIEVEETLEGFAFEIEVEMGDAELEIKIDHFGNITFDD